MIFVDSSGFITRLDADDRNHAAAVRTWAALVRSGRDLITTNYVVTETCAVLQRGLGMEAVRVFRDDLLPAVDLHWVTERQHETGFASMMAANRRKLSLVDCVSFAAMRERRIREAFAFDRHFRDEGFDCEPE